MTVRIHQCNVCGYRPTDMDDHDDRRCPCSVSVDGVEVDCAGTLAVVPLWCHGCKGEVVEIAIVDDYTGALCPACVIDRSLPATQRIPVLSMWDVVTGERS